MTAQHDLVLGIDFGTTYSSAAAVTDGKVEFVLDGGDKVVPSVVYVPPRGAPVVGRQALQQSIADPACGVVSIKRILGRVFDSPEVRRLDAGVGYRIKAGPNRSPTLVVRGGEFAPAQIVALILEHLRRLAEKRFGVEITRAVMTVPADASSAYCEALRRAARFAQMEVAQLVAEPIAGAIALGKQEDGERQRLVVCDFGGGTFDTTLVSQDARGLTVSAVTGDAFLGGDDFDEAIAEAIASHIYTQSGYDMHRDVVRWRELLFRSEAAKRKLSFAESAVLNMREAFTVGGRSHDLRVELTRATVEPRWQPLLSRARAVLAQLLAQAGLSADTLGHVILIGGTSLIPVVQRSIAEYLGRKVETSSAADVAVAYGAALLAGGLAGELSIQGRADR